MEFAFYLAAAVAVVSTLRVVTSINPVHALLYLIVSLIAVAMVFFALGAPFAGVLEIIVYAGAIMVLFVFVVMMLNLGQAAVEQENSWLNPKMWIGPSILVGIMLVMMIVALFASPVEGTITGELIDAKGVGVALFGPYVLMVELASMLLLGALVTAYHLGRDDTLRPARDMNESRQHLTRDHRGTRQ
ncbi:NADH-quinone oxidoreductase subunit J [Larsenimonas suaedae]|uniref:NADH-quinone oxidoreductase subunit J n=1 Tax=Larsenimonas suaedae TaxID=1851019 RepID=A0ABU1GYD4_9GAMM|nr:NADH-quinone oxidoreductase subunit J [Larsenimonas suaedae]MCM2973574.1 NADH-quinone oxidoreductase subunit J [Larsenimonas suaedae]MDR5897056.1 NADH-quinone oxidoreductase subunit J [Larsenimonas suaedae]